MSTAISGSSSFIDKLGVIGKVGDQVVVPVVDEDTMPQLAIATVVEIIRRLPSPFVSELSIRTRSDDDESCIYEPEEIVVLVWAVPALDHRTAAPSTTSTHSLRPQARLRAEQ
ncbi:hypothetical protein [Psychromicrobium sp. YIM B11713]|uniref:hypothetical protein n=1 Tax=Psychromicrobium sp. YIM B11713 TaxID=3145233 RepID=UPI00374EE6CA